MKTPTKELQATIKAALLLYQEKTGASVVNIKVVHQSNLGLIPSIIAIEITTASL